MSIIGKVVLGPFLAEVEKRLNNITDHAAKQGNVLATNMGDEVIRIVRVVQTGYHESLDLTINKIDKTGQELFDKIDLLVRDLERSAGIISKDLRDNMDSIRGQIPLLKTHPQLMEVEGAVITRSSYADSFPLTLQGYFPEIGQQWPTLEINDVVLHPNGANYYSNLARNVFSILGWTAVGMGLVNLVRKDKSSEGGYFQMLFTGAACLTVSRLFFGNNAGNADNITLRKITFDVPFNKLGPPKKTVDLVKGIVKFPRNGWVFNYSDNYPIRITVLPNSPGKITLLTNYSTVQNFKNEKEKLISEVELHSSRTERKGNQESRISIQAPPNWKFDLTTEKIELPTIIEGKKYPLPKGINGKSYGYELITKTQDKVEYRIWTKAVGHQKSGWAVFRLQCEATCIQSAQPDRKKSEEITLGWGSSVVKDVPSNFKVMFKAFDGTSNEFANQDLSNSYIEIKSLKGNKLEIKAKRPNEIHF